MHTCRTVSSLDRWANWLCLQVIRLTANYQNWHSHMHKHTPIKKAGAEKGPIKATANWTIMSSTHLIQIRTKLYLVLYLAVEPPNKGHFWYNTNSSNLTSVESLSSFERSKCIGVTARRNRGSQVVPFVERFGGSTGRGSTMYMHHACSHLQ